MTTLTMTQLYEKQQSLPNDDLILDVRTAQEYAMGHVPGSRNIPFDEVTSHAGELKKYKNIYIYCHSGGRVQMACHELGSMGFQNMAAVVDGGMPDWAMAGYPVERA